MSAKIRYVGKDPTFALGAAAPFMLNPRQQHGWYDHAGGDELFNAFLAKYNVIGFPCGNAGTQWGGWFRKQLKSVADPRGMKMRIAGLWRSRHHARGGSPPADRAGRYLSSAGAGCDRRGRVHRTL
jgi:TRAP-type mannitol/chloroaromatic compound transport system substrate-binding protein